MNWKHIFESLPDAELDKLALLRVIECSNGVIQHMYRDEDEDALTVEESRVAMQYSMSCIKSMKIPYTTEHGDVVVTFSSVTKDVFHEMRRLYISGAKGQNQLDFEEFLKGSKACLLACGRKRLRNAERIVFNYLVDKIPPHALEWGMSYIYNFMREVPERA